ncbi:mandelate racemase/muconate lactonizing enzyme family protein [Candidatus Bathyarchaeota archaeon]|nr:MAG: mandelate racemase/muconate lactonizing enzyme family protein [Candidatus Bathyarchaeota archaeon]
MERSEKLKIKDVEVILLSCPIPKEKRWKLGGIAGQPGWQGVKADMVIIKVHTDEGITGIGEPSPYGGATRLRDAIMRLKPYLIGKDPFDVDLFTLPHRHDRVDALAMAGINIACWDIMGKATGRPICQLLGGRHADRIRVYASGGINWEFVKKPEILVKEAMEYLEQGFTAFKFRIGPDRRFINAIKAVREAVGYEMDLMIEGNMRFSSPAQAIRMAKKFERYEPFWFEEPISGDNMKGYIEIRRALPDIPITGGESRLNCMEFKPWIENRAYDIVQPDCNVTGISEAKRIAFLASLEGLFCCPHNWHNVITTAANLHLVASIPNHLVLEMQQTWHWSCPAFRTEIVKEPLEPKNGYLEVPNKPGLGIELDEKALEKYPFREGPVQIPWEASL